MQTVFSHIVQKRFSQVSEDVATDALAFILRSSESARNGMMKLLRGVEPSLPPLRFETQPAEGTIRPDMRGLDEDQPRVFVENKFWAGLTENQPVAYLQQLAEYTQPSVLLVVAPEAREHTLWRELEGRLHEAGLSATSREASAGILHTVTTDIGPVLTITSWTRLLSALELETAEDPSARSDLLQLRALCEAADKDAFVPVTAEQVTDQRTPAFMLQLGSVLQACIDLAENEGVLSTAGLRPVSSWEGFGRYVSPLEGLDPWLGVRFDLWKTHGGTPLWLVFHSDRLLDRPKMRPLLESWAAKSGVFITSPESGDLVIAIDIAPGEDKDRVVRMIVDRLGAIAGVLSVLKPTPSPDGE